VPSTKLIDRAVGATPPLLVRVLLCSNVTICSLIEAAQNHSHACVRHRHTYIMSCPSRSVKVVGKPWKVPAREVSPAWSLHVCCTLTGCLWTIAALAKAVAPDNSWTYRLGRYRLVRYARYLALPYTLPWQYAYNMTIRYAPFTPASNVCVQNSSMAPIDARRRSVAGRRCAFASSHGIE
jgi:hypothetical protein